MPALLQIFPSRFPARSALTLGIASVAALALAGCAGKGDRPRADLAASQVTTIGVNAYLWRATLDTLSFMPLASADPWGGVVNYDWYVNPQAPNERFKATVFILDRRLRADALNVSVTKEVKDAAGAWTAAPVAAQTETDLENAILTRARQLNLANAAR